MATNFKALGLTSLVELGKSFIGSHDYRKSGPMRETLVKVLAEDSEPLLPKISCRTLLIWGEKDTITPIADGQLMQLLIANATLEIIPNADHDPHLEAPQKVSAAIKELL